MAKCYLMAPIKGKGPASRGLWSGLASVLHVAGAAIQTCHFASVPVIMGGSQCDLYSAVDITWGPPAWGDCLTSPGEGGGLSVTEIKSCCSPVPRRPLAGTHRDASAPVGLRLPGRGSSVTARVVLGLRFSHCRCDLPRTSSGMVCI